MITNQEMQNILDQVNKILQRLEARIVKLEEEQGKKGGQRNRKTLPES
jgi:hypothetical protein